MGRGCPVIVGQKCIVRECIEVTRKTVVVGQSYVRKQEWLRDRIIVVVANALVSLIKITRLAKIVISFMKIMILVKTVINAQTMLKTAQNTVIFMNVMKMIVFC